MIDYEILRGVFALLTGLYLSQAGSLCQLISSNPLSSPSTLGMSGVGVFIVLSSYLLNSFFEFTSLDFLSIELISCSTILCLMMMCFLIRKRSFIHMNKEKVILFGLCFNLFIGAIFTIVQFLLMSKGQKFPSHLWFGSFRFFESWWLYVYIFSFVVSFIILKKMMPSLEVLNLGVKNALNLNVNVHSIISSSFYLALFLTMISVSFFGVFAFLGLVFPHFLRNFSFFKYSLRNELTYGAFFCGFLLLCLDFISFNWTPYGSELPVGMLSTLLGSFLILFLIMKRQT